MMDSAALNAYLTRWGEKKNLAGFSACIRPRRESLTHRYFTILK